MTVTAGYTPPQYSGNGATTTFAFPYPFFAPSDLVPSMLDTTTSLPVAATLNGGGTYDYTVTGTPDPVSGEYPNGSLVFNTAPPGAYTLTIERSVAATQPARLPPNTPFLTSIVEAVLDRFAMLAQQLLATVGLALRFPATEPRPASAILPAAPARAGKILGFNSSGEPIAVDPTNASGTSVTVTGTTTPRLLADMFRATPQSFGALANDAHDDTAAIQAAINAAVAAGGGAIYLPKGKYRYTTLNINGANIQLLGDGPLNTVMRRTTTTGNGLVVGVVGQNLQNIRVSGMSFSPVSTCTAGAEIFVQDTNEVYLDHFKISGGWDGLRIESPGGYTSATYITNFWIEFYSGWAINIGEDALTGVAGRLPVLDTYISEGNVSGGLAGGGGYMRLGCVGGLQMSDVDMTGIATQGIVFNPVGANQTINGVFFANVLSDSPHAHCWVFEGDGFMSNISLTNCWGGASATGCGAYITGSDINGITFNACTFQGNAQDGMAILAGSNIVVNGCQIVQNSFTSAGTYNGISVGAGVSQFSLIGNVSGQGGYYFPSGHLQNYGILVNTGASDGYVILGNRGIGNITAIVADSGTGTHKYVAGNVAV